MLTVTEEPKIRRTQKDSTHTFIKTYKGKRLSAIGDFRIRVVKGGEGSLTTKCIKQVENTNKILSPH